MEAEVLVIGAGGHARVCIEVLRGCGSDVAGCISTDGTASADIGLPMLGRGAELDVLVAKGLVRHFVAVGDNRSRLRAIERSLAAGAEVVAAVSPHAVVSPSARLGRGVLVMPGAVINAGTVIGDGVIVNTNASIDHDCVVGRGVHVAPGCAIAGGVAIGEGAFFGIGSCATPRLTIGPWAVIGAGAAVIDDIEAGTTAVGVPARPLRIT